MTEVCSRPGREALFPCQLMLLPLDWHPKKSRAARLVVFDGRGLLSFKVWLRRRKEHRP